MCRRLKTHPDTSLPGHTCFLKMSAAAFLLTAACWIAGFILDLSGFELIFYIAAIMFLLVSFSFFMIAAIQKFKTNISPYRIFATVNSLIGLCVLFYAVYDIKTGVGWFAGLFGVLLLFFVMPPVIILLAADFLVWLYHRSRSTKDRTENDRYQQ